MTILLILAIIVILIELKTIKTLFVPMEIRKNNFIKNMQKIKSESNQEEIFLLVISLAYLMYIVFYTMTIIYINSFFVSVISIFYILFALYKWIKSIMWISNPEQCKLKSFAIRFVSLGINLSYLGYVVYWIYSHY